MTGKMLRFCQEYSRNGDNGTKAALFAQYSKRSATSMANKLLKKGEVLDKIKEIKSEYAQKHNITPSRILDRHRCIAFFDPADVFDKDGIIKPIRSMKPSVRAAIKSMQIQKVGIKISEELMLFKNKEDLNLFKRQKSKKDKELVYCYLTKVYYHDVQRSLDFLAKYIGMDRGEDKQPDPEDEKLSILQGIGGYPPGQDPHELSADDLEKVTTAYQRKIFLRKK